MPLSLSASTKIIARKPRKRTWWIAWTADKLTSKFPTVHYGFTEPNQETVSGQPSFETFDNEKDWMVRLKEKFGVVPDKVDSSGSEIKVAV